MLGNIVPDVITDSTGHKSWTIQGTGSGTKTKTFTLSQDELEKLSANVQFVGGSANLILTQESVSKTVTLSGSGITQGTIDIWPSISSAGFLPDEPITMKVEVTKITGGQTTISWS